LIDIVDTGGFADVECVGVGVVVGTGVLVGTAVPLGTGVLVAAGVLEFTGVVEIEGFGVFDGYGVTDGVIDCVTVGVGVTEISKVDDGVGVGVEVIVGTGKIIGILPAIPTIK
jgi:hypothetical protein